MKIKLENCKIQYKDKILTVYYLMFKQIKLKKLLKINKITFKKFKYRKFNKINN